MQRSRRLAETGTANEAAGHYLGWPEAGGYLGVEKGDGTEDSYGLMAGKRKSGSRLKRAGRKLDSLLFGIPEDRRSLGLRNPTAKRAAAKRKLYRIGHAAALRNPSGGPQAALVAAERTFVFREAAVTDLSGAREFFLAGFADGAGERRNPKAKSAFDKCVADVAKKGGAYDPHAVCAAAGRKKYGAAEMARRAAAGKKRAARGNPASVLVDGREIFTGSTQEAAALAARLKAEGHQKVTTEAAAKGAKHGWKRNPNNPLDTAGKNPQYTQAQEKGIQKVLDSAARILPSATGPRESLQSIKKVGERFDGRNAYIVYDVVAVGQWRGGPPVAHTIRVTFTVHPNGTISRVKDVRNPSKRQRKKTFRKEFDEGFKRWGVDAKELMRGVKRRKPLKDAERKARQRLKRNPKNPLDTSQSAYEGFHGEKPKGSVTVQERAHFHTHVWAVGKLVLLKIQLPPDRRQPGYSNVVDVEFDYERKKDPAFLTANESRDQLFIDGGDQAVDLKVFGIDTPHEKELLGYLKSVWYFTDKKHLGNEGGLAIYKHKLGEEGGELPAVVYRVRDKRLEIVGGSYTIPDEGVRN